MLCTGTSKFGLCMWSSSIIELMKQNNLNTVPEKELLFRNHILVFIDLLGQKKRLCSLEGVIYNDPVERDRVLQVLRETVGTIWEVRDSFKGFFEQFMNHESTLSPPKGMEEYFSKMRLKSKINFQNFSDSVIIWSPVQFDNEFNYCECLNSIRAILTSIAMITPTFLVGKHPYRGGVDIEGGIVINKEGNELYGPVLNRAYVLESTVAKYPRVVVGKGVIELLDDLDARSYKDKFLERYCKYVVKQCREWIVLDEDGQLMIHFLGEAARDLSRRLSSQEDYFNATIKPINDFISEQLIVFSKDEEIYSRYIRLQNYYNKYLHLWIK